MAKAIQEGRQLSIATPLGKDFLLLNKFSANESLSQLFSMELELLHEEDDKGYETTIIKAEDILGKTVSIGVKQRDEGARYFTGIVSRFSQGNRNDRFSYYYATVVPHVWILTQNVQSRIFQHQSVPDILRKVFAGFEVSYEIQGDFKPRNYCVQYRESDFDFASRLMEEEGIYYYFDHNGMMDRLILANTPQSHRDCPNKSELPYVVEKGSEEIWASAVRTWRTEFNLQSGKVTRWDYHFQIPTQKLDGEQPSQFTIGDNQKMEIYDYPGGYARKYDGIDKTGGKQQNSLNNVYQDKQNTVKIQMQALDAQVKVSKGYSDCCSLTAGHKFKLNNHPSKALNTQYVIVSAQHEAEQTPDYISGTESPIPYEVTFESIPHGAGVPVFRPLMKTPRPLVYGTQTAVVVGPAGEEIFTDIYGRVKVNFHWDRDGKNNTDSSCWLRVAQSWAGNGWGAMFIPRIGMEVIVSFEDGDPDKPIIVGCVYNSDAMPPYKLPEEKTKMTIKSDSTKGGNGFNELRFEDKKGSEQIFVHGEKDIDVRNKNDRRDWVGNDQHQIVINNKMEKVGGDKNTQVLGDLNQKVTGTVSVKADQDIQEKAGKNYAVDAGTEIHLKSGTNLVIETGTTLTLKVGGNFININSSGIFIKGTMVFLNSGGAAGAGIGAHPEAPKEPMEADDAKFGQKMFLPPPPPARVKTYSPSAMVMKNAAKSGVPFCEICEKMKGKK
ncbi:MAG TPA: type VI secretion system tip protein TssI/VgrG [Pyrinomonadaceae bacterium]|nr:type VI secretion system tip protein TssI/VgrG [Pyrinomonadaceae bacterium]